MRTTIERDVVELPGIRKVAEMGQLLRLFAARTGCELVMRASSTTRHLSGRPSTTTGPGWSDAALLLEHDG